MNTKRLGTAVSFMSLGILLSACGTNEAVFVTTTNIGFDADTTPANISIAYNRFEGFYGPTDKEGHMPPVVARIESNLSVTNPKVSQLYATGRAAMDVTNPQEQPANTENPPLEGTRRVSFFGVSSVTGLKVAFNPATLFESLSFGYKRKEVTYLPLIKDPETQQATYPSTLASMNLNTRVSNITDTSEGISQFYATGVAAENLARTNNTVRTFFREETQNAFASLTASNQRLKLWLAENKTAECNTVSDIRFTAGCAHLKARAEAEGIL